MAKPDNDKLDQLVNDVRRAREQCEQGSREQALKMYPHVCARTGERIGPS